MSPDLAAIATRRRALRLVVAVTLGLTFETLRGAALPMLAPVIALQLLAATPVPPPAKMLALLLAVAAGSAALAYSVSAVTTGYSGLYGIAVGLLYLWAFGLTFTPGLRLVGTMMVTMTVVITAMVAVSSGAAIGLLVDLVLSVGEGIFLVVIAHAIFPHPHAPKVDPEARPTGDGAVLSTSTRAVLATAVILPLHLYLTSDGIAAMVILLTTATMLRQPDIAESTRYSLAFAAGNGLGGLLAAFSAVVMALHGEFAVLVSVVTATSLFLATLVVSSDRFASVFLPGFVAYVVLFGLTLSSLPLGDDVDAVKRVLQILVAAAYALGAISLVVPLIGWLERRFTPRPAA